MMLAGSIPHLIRLCQHVGSAIYAAIAKQNTVRLALCTFSFPALLPEHLRQLLYSPQTWQQPERSSSNYFQNSALHILIFFKFKLKKSSAIRQLSYEEMPLSRTQEAQLISENALRTTQAPLPHLNTATHQIAHELCRHYFAQSS